MPAQHVAGVSLYPPPDDPYDGGTGSSAGAGAANNGTGTTSMAKQKTDDVTPKAPRCPVTRERFRSKAPRAVILSFAADGSPTAQGVAAYKEFDTGSLGWYYTGKVTILIDGQPCDVQVGCNLTLVGSKGLPQ